MFINIKKTVLRSSTLRAVSLSFLLMPGLAMAKESPCNGSLNYLKTQYNNDPVTQSAFEKVYEGLTDLPAGYSYNGSRLNPWEAAKGGKGLYRMMDKMFKTWCTALPGI